MKEKIKKVIDDLLNARKEYRQKVVAEQDSKKRFLLQLPNILTLSRPLSLLVILPVAFLGHFGIALLLTGLSALTDFFDGRIARKYNAGSEYGRKLDPICDKVFAIGLGLPILMTHPFLILPTIILESSIASINIASEIRQNHPQSTKLGKVKTWVLGFELTAFYLYQTLVKHNIILPISSLYPFIAVASGMQIATNIQYGYIDQKKQRKKNKAQIDSTTKQLKEKPQSKSSITHQEILELQHLKETLIEKTPVEKDKTKTIGTL